MLQEVLRVRHHYPLSRLRPTTGRSLMRAMIEFCTEAASMCRNYMPQHAIVCVFKDVGARRVMMFWFMLCWGQCLGTNKWMQGHHETQRQMLAVVQYDGSSMTRRVRMPECSQGCYSPISCLRGLMHFVLFSVSGRGCTGVATHSMAALRSGG